MRFNQNGMSTLQIVIMSGVLSVVFAAVAKLVALNRNMYNEITSVYNIDEINSQIFMQLLDRNACIQTFSAIAKATPTASIVNVKDAGATNVFTTGLIYSRIVRIESMTVSNYIQDVVNIEPYNATFDLTILYSYPYGEGGANRKSSDRVFQIRTLAPSGPAPWSDGAVLSDAVNGCVSAGALAQSGLGSFSSFIVKTGADTKNSNFTMAANTGATNNNIIVNGDALLTGQFIISDKNSKENIQKIENASKIVENLKPYKFKWKNSGRTSYGFMAQDLEKELPEVVGELYEGGIKGVQYGSVVPILWETTKEMESQNRIKSKLISALESRMDKLEADRKK